MTYGTRTENTETVVSTQVMFEYDVPTDGSKVHVLVTDGMMTVTAEGTGVPFSAQLPLAAAPLMQEIAADMVEELQKQTTQNGSA